MMVRSARAAFWWLFPAESLERYSRWSRLSVATMVATVAGLLLAGATGLLQITRSGPVGVVLDFYETGNAGEYDRTLEYLSSSARAQALGLGTDGWEAAVDELTRDRTIVRLKPLATRFVDDHAVVFVSVVYGDGNEALRVDRITEEDTGWKLEWPDGIEELPEPTGVFYPYVRFALLDYPLGELP